MACLKNPYPNQVSALRALDAIRERGKEGSQPVRVYPCQECSRWHLTSKRLTGKVPSWERHRPWPVTA